VIMAKPELPPGQSPNGNANLYAYCIILRLTNNPDEYTTYADKIIAITSPGEVLAVGDTVIEVVNQLGSEGWRVISIFPTSCSDRVYMEKSSIA